MKLVLSGIGLFAVGLMLGAGVMGFVVKSVYQKQMAQIHSMNVASDVLLAQQLRGGLAQILLEATDRRIIDGVLQLHRNEDLKDLDGTQLSITAAKEYYTCSKIHFPAEIAQIMNELPPVSDSKCKGE